MRKKRLSSLFILASIILSPACGGPESPRADAVFINGAVYTVDAARSWATAVAIRGDEIIHVGSDESASRFSGPNTKVVDLKGRMMLPAFQDAHIHAVEGGMERLAVSLHELDSVNEYVAAIKAYADEHPDEAWITGAGWSIAAFGPGGRASRKLIDDVVPDRPVYLETADGHTAWVNTKALEIAGIGKNTPDPEAGIIDRDPVTGEAFGSLQEHAQYLVKDHIPAADLESRTAGLRYAMNMLNAYGITSIQAAKAFPKYLEAYRALDERNELNLRVVASLYWDRDRGEEQIDDLLKLRSEYTKGRVRATSVKLWQDGVMENFTAALLEPYLQKGDNRGFSMIDPEALKRAAAKLDALGFQLHFHAIGDAAVRQCLDAVEEARMQNGDLGHRHHIAHLQLIYPDDIPRFRELGVIANFQPLWALADAYQTELTIPYLGPERSSWQYPIRSMRNSGAMIAFGSDWGVSTANPFEQMETAVTRMGSLGETTEPFYPEERIDLPSAIAAFTINAAYVNHIDDITGSIEVGKLADLIVLDNNLFELDQADLSDTHVLLTLMEGKPVFGDLSAL
jgi:predicted amidohydrolase YtcJ